VPALRGDLDNIVLMALRKEPGRRYATAQQFAEDIRRYEVGLPVVARKDTLFYRTGKFVRRNRWRVAAAALVAVSLLTGTVVALQQARRAERQSEAARTMAMTMLIDVNEKFRVLPGSVDGRRLLVEKGLEGLDLISKEARGDPVVMWDLARGYERIASLQASPDPAEPTLWDRTKGLELYRRALAIAETLRQKGRNDQDMLLLLNYIHLGIGGNTPDLPEATRHLQQSLELNAMLKPELGRRWEPDGPPLVSYLRDEAYFILSNKTRPTDPQAALEYSRKVSHAQMRGWGIMTALHRLGDLQGAANQALSIERHTAQEIEHRGFPNDLLSQVQAATRALSAIVASNSLGNPFGPNLDDPLSAADACKRAVAGLEDALKRDPTDPNLRARRFLGLACLGAALSNTNPQASVAAYREALSREEHLPPRISAFGAYFEPRWQISYPLRKLGMRSEALQQARQALERRLSVAAHLAVGDAELDLGNRPAALEHYRLALAMAEKQVAAVPRDMVLRDQLGRAYQRLGNYHETANDLRAARDWYEKALDVWRGWTKYGISSPYNVRREREAARMIARCEARLARK
jgi:non-specific serine/threonine protein kinase/serine/threonine-protein kinase